MLKKTLGFTVGLAALAAAVPAYAGTAYFVAGDTTATVPNNGVMIADFDTGSPTYGTGVFAGTPVNTYGVVSANVINPPTTAAPIRRPTGDTSSQYAYVSSGASYTISFSPAEVFTFIFGSLNSSNSLTLNFAGSPSQTFTGGQLAGLATAAGAAGQYGRFVYDAQGIGGAAGTIVSAVFTSGIGAGFEFDSIATAAPEPAAWLMMILGFGMVGATIRLRRPALKSALA